MNQQITNINSENTPFKIIMCIFIMIIGASLIISGFFYFTINKTIKINAIITGLDLTTSTATASYTLHSQPYSIDVDSSNLNINDTLTIWVRSNNPNIVFLNDQSSEHPGILLMILGSCILFFSLLYCSIKFSNYTTLLPIGSSRVSTPSPPPTLGSSPLGTLSIPLTPGSSHLGPPSPPLRLGSSNLGTPGTKSVIQPNPNISSKKLF
jgi:hypothetical protein